MASSDQRSGTDAEREPGTTGGESSDGAQGVRSSTEEADQRRGPVLPPHTEDHGHSAAAWTGVVIVMVGSLVASIAVVILNWWVFAAGIVVALVGPLVGRVMSAKGMGAKQVDQSSDAPGDAPHDHAGRRSAPKTSSGTR